MVGANASPFDMSATQSAPQMVAPVAAPQNRGREQSVEVNPFDQFDNDDPEPDAGQLQAQQTSAGPDQSDAQQPQQLSSAPVQYADHTVDATDAQRIASETFNTDIANLVNSGATRQQIEARIAQAQAMGNQASVNGLDEALAYRDKYHAAIPVGIANDEGLVKPPEYHAPDRGRLDSFAAGALDSISLGSGDEIGGALGAAANSAANVVGAGTGENFGDAYSRMRDENRQILNDDQHYNPGTYLTGQIAGSVASLPLGGELSAGRALAEGAAYGGAYGFNSATGDLGDRAVEGLKGAAFGGLVGGTVGAAGSRIARGIAERRANPSEARQILSAADRLNQNAVDNPIRPILGHTSNGGFGSTLTATGEEMLVPGQLGGIKNATQRFEEAGGAARDRIASDFTGGTVMNLDDAAARLNDRAIPG